MRSRPHQLQGIGRAIESLVDRRAKGTTRHVGSVGGEGHGRLSEGGETGPRTVADAMPAAIQTGPSVDVTPGAPISCRAPRSRHG